MRQRRWIVLGVAAGGGLLLALVWSMLAPRPPAPAGATAKEKPAGSDSAAAPAEAALEHMAADRPERTPSSIPEVSGPSETSERLSREGLAALLHNIDGGIQNHREKAAELAALPPEETTLETLAEQALSLATEALLMEVRSMVLRGEYTTVPINGSGECPSDCVEVRGGSFQTVSGQRVFVVVCVPKSSPVYAERVRIHEELRRAADEEYVGKFNNLPYEERRARYEAHVRSQTWLQKKKYKNVRQRQVLERDLLRFMVKVPGYEMVLPAPRGKSGGDHR